MKFLDNLFKKPEKDRKAAYKPSSSQTKAVEAKGGGKGSARDIEFSKGGPSSDQRKRILASQNDNSFGYYDMNSGKYIPAFVDMFDGGGRNTSGDTFQGAGLYSAALNAAGVAPYGYNRPRTYAQAGMENRPSLPSMPTQNNSQPEVTTTVLPRDMPNELGRPPTSYMPPMMSNFANSKSEARNIMMDRKRNAETEAERNRLSGESMGLFNYQGYVDRNMMTPLRQDFITEGLMPPQVGGYDFVPESLPNAGFYKSSPETSMLGSPPQSTDLAAMMEMLRREMEAKELRSALPTLLGQ